MPRLFTRATLVLSVANAAALAGGLTFAAVTGDGHAAQRTGAVLAAITGFFVIWQVTDEIRMEGAMHHQATDGGSGLALDRAADRLVAAAASRRESAIRQARLVMVATIAVWLSVGEVLHGFGDLMLPGAHAHAAPAATPTVPVEAPGPAAKLHP